MIYLIGQLAGWLLLTAAFASLAGWAFAAQRAAPVDASLKRERDGLVRDIVALASGESGAANDSVEVARELDAARRLAELNKGRLTELEEALSLARAREAEAVARVAELQRALDAREAPAVEAKHVEIAPVAERSAQEDELQTWRLRYFEQRVKYLEGKSREPTPAVVSVTEAEAPPVDAWRARVAEATAAHFEREIRAAAAQVESEVQPFAANADVDALLRWRMLYLERRVAHLQRQMIEQEPVEQEPAPQHAPAEAAPDPDRWKWRARYLEARTRHLEQRLSERPMAVAPAGAPNANDVEEEAAPPPAPTRRGTKPPTLPAARHGAPDDFTLIDGVSLLQQSTLYSIGIFHFDQIAGWSADNVAWVANYLRLGDRIAEEEWVEQAASLAREGPAAARRAYEDEDA